MNPQGEAIELFRKYRDTLTGEFLTLDEAQRAEVTAKIFLEKLDELGFAIASHPVTTMDYERAQNGETITVLTLSFNLSLVPKGTSFTNAEVAAKRIHGAEAIAKIYGSLPAVPPPRNGEWNFTEMERHVFLCALTRHGEKFTAACKKRNIQEPVDDWRTIFSGVGAMTIGLNDAFVFGCLLEAEIPFLETAGDTHRLDGCACQANEHIAALKAWKRRNIRGE